jgi:hypothetical protein
LIRPFEVLMACSVKGLSAQGFDRLSPNGIQDFVGPDQPEVLFDSTLRGVKGQDGVIQSARRNR